MNLRKKIIGAIKDSVSTAEMDGLFLELFRVQYGKNTAYRNYCDHLGIGPDSVLSWDEIPPVVTDVFKCHSQIPLRSFSGEATAVFHTSGTTSAQSGHHAMKEVEVYEASVLSAWDSCGLPAASTSLFLAQPADASPHSSLLRMFSFLKKRWGMDDNTWIQTEAGFDLQKLRNVDEPVGLLGTALSFLTLFNQLGDEALVLPKGSWAMETGGYKGSRQQFSKEELYAMFQIRLGLSREAIWNEYSMTELSSQFYTRGIDQVHRGPAWLRTRIIDPETGKDVETGEMGYLVIYDLANVDSVCAVQTQDFAIQAQNGFLLVGRDPGALPRGCSRAF